MPFGVTESPLSRISGNEQSPFAHKHFGLFSPDPQVTFYWIEQNDVRTTDNDGP